MEPGQQGAGQDDGRCAVFFRIFPGMGRKGRIQRCFPKIAVELPELVQGGATSLQRRIFPPQQGQDLVPQPVAAEGEARVARVLAPGDIEAMQQVTQPVGRREKQGPQQAPFLILRRHTGQAGPAGPACETEQHIL